MHILPTTYFSDEKSVAEECIYNELKDSQLDDSYFALHSIRIPFHRFKKTGQADFLILTNYGLLLLEVKGGVIEKKDRSWFSVNRYGERNKLKEDPAEQAKWNLYSINDEIKRKRIPYNRYQNLFGYGVLFPETKKCDYGQGFNSKITFFAEDLDIQDSMASFINKLEEYWMKPGKTSQLSSIDKKKMKDWFNTQTQPLFSCAPARRNQERRKIQLLEDQKLLLDGLWNKQRNILSGGAGTGKTLLGIEHFKDKSCGFNAAFVVPSELHKIHLARKTDCQNIITYKEFMRSDSDSYEFLIVDEAQDYMCDDFINQLDQTLIGGTLEGNWMLLIDENNQTNIAGTFDQNAFDLLLEAAGNNRIPLQRNVRNTHKIIETVEIHTKRSIGQGGFQKEGPKPKYIKYSSDESDLCVKLDIEISDIIDEGLNIGDIVLLGRNNCKKSKVYNLLQSNNYQIEEVSISNMDDFPFKKKIGYATIQNFKGLESYVVIFDYGEFEEQEFLDQSIYVALTRATSKLIILYPDSMKNALSRLI